MGIETNMYSNIRPLELESPVNALSKVLQVQNMQQQGKIGQMELDKYSRGLEAENAESEAYKGAMGPDGKMDRNKLYSNLTQAGRGAKVSGLQKGFADQDKAERDAKAAEIEFAFKNFERAGQIMGGVKDQATWDIAIQQTAQVFGPEAAAQMPAQYNPALIEQRRQQAMGVKDQLIQHMKELELENKKDEFNRTDKRIKSEGAANRGVQLRGQNLTDARSLESNNGADTGLTDDAITNTAARYNMDGTLPPMGMGKSVSAGRFAILNRAAELAYGIDPSQQRVAQLDNKNEAAARGLAYKAYGPNGNEGKSIQSANTGLNHLDTVVELAKAQKSGDVQAFNRIARYIGSQTGQAAPTNLNAALVMVAPEITKAVVGAGGGVEDRRHAAEALNPNSSPDQIIGAAGTIQELFGGRLTESKRTYERTTKKKDFDESMLSPAARRVISKASKTVESSGKTVLKVTTPADYAKVPSGAEYVTPDGHTRRKP